MSTLTTAARRRAPLWERRPRRDDRPPVRAPRGEDAAPTVRAPRGEDAAPTAGAAWT
jgi:hypothetical protein